MSEMTRTERNDLAGLARKRARVAKDTARQRAAELTAEAEERLSTVFSEQDERWASSVAEARATLGEVNERIRGQLSGEGVPDEMLPSLVIGWNARGSAGTPQRRAELRALARARIDAQLKSALAAIEASSVNVQTELLASGLTTDAAQKFLLEMPSVNELLVSVEVEQLMLDTRKAAR